jgi:hypothetical protein
MRFLLLSISASVLIAHTLIAQSSAQNDAAIPPAVVEYWEYFIGDWEIQGQIRTTPVMGTASFEWSPGKYCYVEREAWRIGEKGSHLHLTALGGWDAAEQAWIKIGFSTSGESATVRYPLVADDAKPLEGTIDGVDRAGGRWSGKTTLDRKSRDEFQLTTTNDGQLAHSLTYVRKTYDKRATSMRNRPVGR